MIERVKQLIDCKSKSVREFSSMINVKQVTLNQQITGSRSLSLDVVTAILNSFEDVSAEWLMRGKGEMFLLDEIENSTSSDNISGDDIQRLRERIISLESENKVLREIVGLHREERSHEGKIA